MAEEKKTEEFRPFRSITRLLIGGVLLGSELIEEQLRGWEGQGEKADSEIHRQPPIDPLPDTLPPPQVGDPSGRSYSDVPYAIIGVIFEGEEKLEKALAATKQIGDLSDRVLDPLVRPIKKSGIGRPFRKGFNRLTRRGQLAIDRWISRGREEEAYSRELTQKAATSTVDESIHYMAENKAITELIQTQSVSLAEQILELVRAISCSADYFFEGQLRYIFKRTPRYLLPPPSQDVQKQATWMLQDIRHEDL